MSKIQGFPVSFAGVVGGALPEDQILAFAPLVGGVAKSIRITNLDAAAILQYRLNVGEPLRTIAASGIRIFNDQLISWLELDGNAATGAWEVEAEILSLEDLKKVGAI